MNDDEKMQWITIYLLFVMVWLCFAVYDHAVKRIFERIEAIEFRLTTR